MKQESQEGKVKVGTSKEEGDRLFSVISSNRKRGNTNQRWAEYRKFHLNIRIVGFFFYCKGAQTMEDIGQRVVESPSMDTFKA